MVASGKSQLEAHTRPGYGLSYINRPRSEQLVRAIVRPMRLPKWRAQQWSGRR